MIDRQKHIIHRLNVDVEVADLPSARRLYQNTSQLIQQYVLPALEAEMDMFTQDDTFIQAGRLTLDIELPDEAGMETSLPGAAAAAMRRVLQERLSAAVAASLNNRVSNSAAAQTPAAQKTNPSVNGETVGAGSLQQTAQPGVQSPAGQAVQDQQDKDNPVNPAFETANPAGDAQPGEEDVEQRSLAEKTKAVFIYFLQTGKLPWYAGTHTAYLDEAHLLDTIFNDSGWVSGPFATAIARSPISFIKRLVLQFSPSFLLRVITAHSNVQADGFWQQLQQIMAGLTPAQKNTIQHAGLAMLAALVFTGQAPQQQPLQQPAVYIHRLLQQAVEAGIISAHEMNAAHTQLSITAATENTASRTGAGTIPVNETAISTNPVQPAGTAKDLHSATPGLFVFNGGLMLLHPFLERFFTEHKLLTAANRFAGKREQQIALHLLYYLATGQEQPFDRELLFEKYLCGIPAEESVDRSIQLSAAMKAEADNLLRAAVQHWAALKNTSPDGLRQAFLQRQAKLVTAGTEHKLIITPGTTDALLQQLPWGYSVIQLPWMQQLLHVDIKEEAGPANPVPGTAAGQQENPFLQPPANPEKKRYRPVEEETGLFVVNAGLVLLHPFLEYFFKECKLVTGKQFTGEAEQQTALHLLYYLATGKEQPFECDLLFERYLCGIPAEEPVDRFIQLPGTMKAEADNLLQAAIQHWKALKNTSAGGLRQGFLQREGKLVTTGMQHRLIIAPETIDILLQQLPWGYSVIQMPWMQQLLHVEWNNV